MKNEKEKHAFDLEERTAIYAEDIIGFCKLLPPTVINRPIISQLIRSGTSIAANYCEADCSETVKDFVHKMVICKKEAKETRFWLRAIAKAVPERKPETRELWQEGNELIKIFSTIIRKTKSKMRI